MAISWGSWEYSNGNGMRVGIEATVPSVSHGQARVTATFKVYTQNQYSYNDDQSLTISGSSDWTNPSYHNNDGSGAVLRTTKTFEHEYSETENSYGTGNARTVTLTATVAGAYNGVSPTKTVTVGIPRRPYAAPAAPSAYGASRVSDTSVSLAWTRHPSVGAPYDYQHASVWDNVSNSWKDYASDYSGTATTASHSISGNRRYRWRIWARNSAGRSAMEYSNFIQTTPSAPASLTNAKGGTSSILLRWTNQASAQNGYDYDTLIEEQANGGAWTQVATVNAGVTSFLREGRNPGTAYRYRVRARSTVGDTTYSGYSTASNSITLQLPPAAITNLTAARTSDTSHTVSWTNHPTTSAPYDKIVVQRRDTTTNTLKTIATLPGTATSFVDTGTAFNQRFHYSAYAINSVGQSPLASSVYYQTTPSAITVTSFRAVPGGVKLTWANNTPSGYVYTLGVRYYENGTLVTDTVTLTSGTTEYTVSPVNLAANYKVGIRVLASVGNSGWVDSETIGAATIPSAPDGLAPNGKVIDLARDQVLSWVHNPSADDSGQTKLELRYSSNAGSTWTSLPVVTSTESSWTLPAGTLANGATYDWQVRTWGVHATASPWSASATLTGSATPEILVTSPTTVALETSTVNVAWTYTDQEGTNQAAWELQFLDSLGNIIEAQQGQDATTSLTLATATEDASSYLLRVRVQDSETLWSDWFEVFVTTDFTPPAPVDMAAEYSTDSGAGVLSLAPTPDEPGVSLPATSATLQRRIIDPETEEFGEWETIAENVDPAATLVDPTAPIAGDGEYRVVTYSAAPSSVTSTPVKLNTVEDRWVYLSGGTNFSQVCRLMGNVAISSSASRDRALYNFAGRPKPVLFQGEARSRQVDISGILDEESTPPAQWEALIHRGGVMLLRDPLGRRIYGSVSDVSLDRLSVELYSVSFTLTEVDY